MLTMWKLGVALKDRYLSQKAQGMVEYALIIAFVVAIAVALSSDGGLADAISGVFGTAGNKINAGNTAANASSTSGS